LCVRVISKGWIEQEKNNSGQLRLLLGFVLGGFCLL
jgi:hypothetical protein